MGARRIKKLAAAGTLAALAVTGLGMESAGAAMNCTQLHQASARMARYMEIYMELGWYGEWEYAYMSWEYFETRIEAEGC